MSSARAPLLLLHLLLLLLRLHVIVLLLLHGRRRLAALLRPIAPADAARAAVFLLSACTGADIVVWQQPDLRRFARFGGRGEGSVKALAVVGGRVFSAHQDGRVRVWCVSCHSENAFKLVASLPTAKDYLGRIFRQASYVQTRCNHRRLWIEHADSISCLAVHDGLDGVLYSGSWDKTLKVWHTADLKCLESIRTHNDAVNAVAADGGVIYSASADGRVKAWEKGKASHFLQGILVARDGVSPMFFTHTFRVHLLYNLG